MTVNHMNHSRVRYAVYPLLGQRAVGVFSALFAAAVCWAGVLHAQQPAEPVHATLKGWEEYARITILDRSGSFFGRLAEQGILQRFGHRELDAEYDLDLVSFSPSLEEEYRWYASDDGVRFWTGSINHLHLVQNAQFKALVPLSGTWVAGAQIYHQRTLQARRSLVQLTLAHDLRPQRLRIFFSGTLKDDKPDTDLEAGVVASGSRGSAVLAVGALDPFNDFITQTLGVSYLTDSIVDYTAHPFSGRLSFELSLSPDLRLEAYALAVTPSSVKVSLSGDSAAGFVQDERYGYAAGLLEWTPNAGTAVGLLASWVRSRIARSPGSGGKPQDDFELTESETRWGLYAIHRFSSRWSAEGWVSRVIRPDKRIYREPGAGADARYRDRAWSGRLSGTYQARSGFRGELGLDFVARGIPDPGAVPDRAFLADNNYRLRFDLGWRFGSRALFVVGSNVDLDKDNGTAIGTFDGGHGRFAFYW
ncbi:MAG: hypothetical protein KatS3mg081_0054 [Gemmatimonadales bacterium]|nr:MAG: hypothetical protein KatS3mg081_0054 [Gemmatimonadales bacterium]